MSAASQPAWAWKNLPWRELERAVRKLQQRLFGPPGVATGRPATGCNGY